MNEDAEVYTPFAQHCKLQSLAGCISSDAKFLEQFYINKYDALGTSGDNILQGHPPSCRRYWAMFRSGSLH